jgi:hypothetical protein
MIATVDSNTSNAGDGSCHISTSGFPNTPATENTFLNTSAKQTYFKEQRIQIPHTEKVCNVEPNVV